MTRATLLVLAGSLASCALVLDLGTVTFDPSADGGVAIDEGGSSPGPDADAIADVTDAGDSGEDAVACPDTDSSAHCGRCFHGCAGGACVAGRCQPVYRVVASGVMTGVDVTSSDVFVAAYEAGGVLRVPKDGGAAVVVSRPLADGGDVSFGPWGVVANDAHVYWTLSLPFTGSLVRSPLDGGASEIVLADLDEPRGLALGGAIVVASERNANDVVGVAAGGGARLFTYGTGEPVGTVAAAGGDFFWLAEGSGSRGRLHGDGGLAELHVTQGSDARGLATADDVVYWGVATFAPAAAGIFRSSRDGGGAVRIASAGVFPTAVGVDPTWVYWAGAQVLADGGTSETAGGVYACRRDTTPCAPIPLAETDSEPQALALDVDAVYWVDRVGRLGWVAKP